MIWTKIDPQVREEDGVYVIPYVRGTVDMFGTPAPYKRISAELAVEKERVSSYFFDEQVFFVGDDWSSWMGQEVGYRFPMCYPRDYCSIYTQHPFGAFLWWEWPIKVKNLNEYHVYTIELQKWGIFKLATFKVDGRVKVAYLLANRGRSYLPVFCSHNHLDKNYDFTMRLKSIDHES